MNTKRSNIKKIARIKLSVLILMTASVIGSYATMGIYATGKNSDRPKSRLLAPHSVLKPGTFSLKSGYAFRGSQVLVPEKPVYININGVGTYQIGNTVYAVPMGKQVLLNGKLKVSIQNQFIR